MDESTAGPDPQDSGLEAVDAMAPSPTETHAASHSDEFVDVAEPLWPPHELPGEGYPSWAIHSGRITPPPVPTPQRRGWGQVFAAAVLGSILTVVVLVVGGVFDGPEPGEAPSGPPVEVHQVVREPSPNLAAAVGRKVTPSVVAIEIGLGADEMFRPIGGGSGVIVGDGVIVTNDHVIQASENVRVVLHDGRTYPAEIVGADADTDLAVLRIGGGELVSIDLGDTDTLTVGDTAIAVGNPLGLSGGASLTVGVISAFDRQVTAAGASSTLYGMVQTDAPITQGSSGGALVDENGQLIGITTAIGVSTAGAEGIGFAIPVELMRRVTDELLDEGVVRRAFLGVELRNEFQQRSDGGSEPAGALVAGFAPQTQTAARTAGIVAGDLITGFQGQPITNREQLISSLRHLRVGDEVEIEVVRNGETVAVNVVLGEQDAP